MEANQVLAYQQRVVDEKNELDAKRRRLEAFLVTETFAGLPSEERFRLRLQVLVMQQYSEILGERIAAFN